MNSRTPKEIANGLKSLHKSFLNHVDIMSIINFCYIDCCCDVRPFFSIRVVLPTHCRHFKDPQLGL
jgi:hypothetical protein